MMVIDSKETLLKSDDEEDLIFDHSTLLQKDVAFRESGYRCCPSGGKLQIAKTVNLCLSFFGLGLCFAIPTATLNDLQTAVQANENIKNIYTARYSGYLFGAIIGGFLFDCYNRQFLLFLSLLATGIGIIIMPFCQELPALMACTAVTGITMGFLDTGGNVWCLDLWGQKSAPFMQTLHFCFGLGAFVAPLVAEPFLSPLSAHRNINSTENVTFSNGSSLSVPRVGLPKYPLTLINGKHALVKHSINEIDSFWSLENRLEFDRTKREVFNDTELTSNATEIVINPDFNLTGDSRNSTFAFNKNKTESLETTPLSKATTSTTITSTTTTTTTTTVKPKPKYVDGNQLPQDQKWVKPKLDANGNPVLPPEQIKSVTMSKPITDEISNGTKAKFPETNISGDKVNLTTPTSSSDESEKLNLKNTTLTTIKNVKITISTSPPELDTTNHIINNLTLSSDSTSKNLTYPLTKQPKIDIGTSAVTQGLIKTNKATSIEEMRLSTTVTEPTTGIGTKSSVKKANPQIPQESKINEESQHIASDKGPSAILLGKTHFPPLKPSTSHPQYNSSHTEQPTPNIHFTSETTITPPISDSYANYNPSFSQNESDSLLSNNQSAKSRDNDIFSTVYNFLRKNRLGKFEIPYILLAIYIFVVAIIFLVFLCKNPREPRSMQLEDTNKSRDLSLSFRVVMVGLMSLFLCLYVGIEVSVGELLETFATKENLQLPQSRGYFLPYVFWASFSVARGISIFIATRFSSRAMLIKNLSICLAASIVLVAGADKLEALLWIGIVVLGCGMGPLFPTSISWLGRYLHITNKTASIFVLGAAIGEIVIPIIVDLFINQEPMVLMYVNIIVNALCYVSFIVLCVMASKHKKYGGKKPNRSMYELANTHDYDDSSELLTTNNDRGKSTTNGYYLQIKNRHISGNGSEFSRN